MRRVWIQAGETNNQRRSGLRQCYGNGNKGFVVIERYGLEAHCFMVIKFLHPIIRYPDVH